MNANIDYQFFCDMHLAHLRLTNYKIVSQIHYELDQSLSIENVEKTLFNHWSGYIKEQGCIFKDATCYKDELRYQTDQKLLWESVDWSYHQMKKMCKDLKLKLPRTKYLKWKKRYIGYRKMRRKTYKKRTPLTRSLLYLLKKINKELDSLEKKYNFEMPSNYYKRRATIKKISNQLKLLFDKGEKQKNRIVSIKKEYHRPIVRGKEINAVKFGAKVNKLQIDGINFIQHISFDNFNEGTQYKNTIYKAQGLTKFKVKTIGANAIYATNKNRIFATSNKIKTNFKPKGRPTKHRI